MDQIGSPDVPAFANYLLVLIVGMMVARSQVNRLLPAYPQRWGFLSTWTMFWAHAAIPVGLFWFLDYTNAVRDTSLFAALLVAFGYRQIFVGGVDSIRLPGQTQRLWQPFEAWVTRVVQRINVAWKRYRDRFDDRVVSFLADDPERTEKLMTAAYLRTVGWAQLEKALADLDSQAAPKGMSADAFSKIQQRKRVSLLLNDLQSAAGDNYGYFLYRAGVIPGGRYVLWFGNTRSRVIAGLVSAAVAAVLILGTYEAYGNQSLRIRYDQWRFMKTNNSDLDRFRSRKHLVGLLQAASASASPDVVNQVLTPMLFVLRYRGCSNKVAEDVLDLVWATHRPIVDAVAIPELIEALRTENSDIRLRVLRTLLDLAEHDYNEDRNRADSKLHGEAGWIPAKDDSPGAIDAHVKVWESWAGA